MSETEASSRKNVVESETRQRPSKNSLETGLEPKINTGKQYQENYVRTLTTITYKMFGANEWLL